MVPFGGRTGKPVKIRYGPAAVTGDETRRFRYQLLVIGYSLIANQYLIMKYATGINYSTTVIAII